MSPLGSHNLRITRQRQILLDELCSVKTHPTVDELYQMVRKRLPKISLGTVYRNLEIMSDCGIIQKLDIGGTQKRFDGSPALHYHVRCIECGRVDDLDLDPKHEVEKEASAKTSYKILRHRLEFTGVCPTCQA